MMALPTIIPNATFGQTSAAVLNQTASSPATVQSTASGENTLLPLVYGTQIVGARISGLIVYNNNLVVRAEWCLGEVDAVSESWMDDAALPAGVSVTHYTGTAGQGVNGTLAAAYAALGQSYTETLPGVCYSVFAIPPATSHGFPRLTARIRGLKIRTTYAGARSYQDNPAYIIADFIESTTYGMARAVDWATVATLAALCDATVGGERKRILNIVLDSSESGETWLQVLRDYAGCWAVPEGASYRLVADTTGSSVMSFSSTNIVAGSAQLDKRGTRSSPTVLQIDYTDTTTHPYRTGTATLYAMGVLAGTTPRRLSRVAKPGITRYSEANRYGVERLNESLLNDLTVRFSAFDPALSLQVGDLIDVTHPIGLTAKLFRAIKIDSQSPGRWQITALEYDPAKYSSAVVSGPSVVDTAWPSPSSPPTPGAITLSEEIYQVQIGTYSSRIRATWAAVSWPFLAHYRIVTRSGGAVIDTATLEATDTSYATPAVREGLTYQVDVSIVSTTLAVGAPASSSLTSIGKYLIPGDVPTLTGFEAGGTVFLYWGAAADLDIWRYEIRYGLTSGSWASATVIDRVDALTYQANGIPAGPWRFYLKAIDSVRQYSTNAKTLDVTVTLDASAFLLGIKVFDDIGTPTLTSMTAYSVRSDALTYYVTDFGDGVGYGADNTNNSIGTFGDSLVSTVLANPHTAGTSKFVTPSWDVGQSLTGNFTGTITYSNVSGTASYWIETSPDNSTWTQWTGGTAKTTARYVRLRLETSGTMLVSSGSSARVDASPREENGTITTSASGASTVTLGLHYTAVKTLQLTPKGTTSRQAIYDNIVVHPTNPNTFDVYLFNAAGTQIAGDVSWLFQGI